MCDAEPFLAAARRWLVRAVDALEYPPCVACTALMLLTRLVTALPVGVFDPRWLAFPTLDIARKLDCVFVEGRYLDDAYALIERLVDRGCITPANRLAAADFIANNEQLVLKALGFSLVAPNLKVTLPRFHSSLAREVSGVDQTALAKLCVAAYAGGSTHPDTVICIASAMVLLKEQPAFIAFCTAYMRAWCLDVQEIHTACDAVTRGLHLLASVSPEPPLTMRVAHKVVVVGEPGSGRHSLLRHCAGWDDLFEFVVYRYANEGHDMRLWAPKHGLQRLDYPLNFLRDAEALVVVADAGAPEQWQYGTVVWLYETPPPHVLVVENVKQGVRMITPEAERLVFARVPNAVVFKMDVTDAGDARFFLDYVAGLVAASPTSH